MVGWHALPVLCLWRCGSSLSLSLSLWVTPCLCLFSYSFLFRSQHVFLILCSLHVSRYLVKKKKMVYVNFDINSLPRLLLSGCHLIIQLIYFVSKISEILIFFLIWIISTVKAMAKISMHMFSTLKCLNGIHSMSLFLVVTVLYRFSCLYLFTRHIQCSFYVN